ncbi:response regulator [Lactiplantibacillus pentosus]|uniref:Response regulator n=2 Tax=Lactiplantibacillus pentosus TaxID=1589 RepID=A0AAX6LFK6_LACPE|nr:response regulator [Lactiplantibacillus pentosus]MBU7496007.1 response regulator [Lactiplantibacillus pentosus]MCT3294864.1 response regulator [Lactiplantibacillus pentosus]MCT3329222.1 response regulator [Lactiplantibacillus pentosus]MDF2313310.1 response regulator [Lactiplantibacillus pentosus]WMB62058.1 response regulator [Lactiplantibacillus pentosus]
MRRLMVVDDEQALRNGLANYLQKIQSPFDEVITASTGREALDYVDKHLVSAALIDINLGDMNGLDLIELINHRYPDILVVIISGFDDFDFARRAIKLQVIDYLLKPIPRSDLQKLMTVFQHRLLIAPTSDVAASLTLADNVKSYIESHYSEKGLSLGQVASALFVSDTYLSRQLKQVYGRTFSEYLIAYRIQRAQELLTSPILQYTVTAIANKVGYEDPHYFSRLFRKKTGLSPIQFRERQVR